MRGFFHSGNFLHAAALLAFHFFGRSWRDMILTGNDTSHLKGYGFSLWIVLRGLGGCYPVALSLV